MKKHLVIHRYNLPPAIGNPVVKCRTFERIAPVYNFVRSNNPNWLHNVRAMRGATCYLFDSRLNP